MQSAFEKKRENNLNYIYKFLISVFDIVFLQILYGKKQTNIKENENSVILKYFFLINYYTAKKNGPKEKNSHANYEIFIQILFSSNRVKEKSVWNT